MKKYSRDVMLYSNTLPYKSFQFDYARKIDKKTKNEL